MIDYPHLGDAKVAYVVCGLRVYEVRCHRGKDGIWTFLARDGRRLHPDPKNVSRVFPGLATPHKLILLREAERRAWGLPWTDGYWMVHPAMTTQEKRWLMMTGKPMTPSLPVFVVRCDALRKLSVLADEAERAAAQADKVTSHACLFKAMVLREACDTLRVAWEESDRAERDASESSWGVKP